MMKADTCYLGCLALAAPRMDDTVAIVMMAVLFVAGVVYDWKRIK